MNIRLALVYFLLCVAAMPVSAQSYSQTVESIARLNDYKPLQNPALERGSELLGHKVIDGKNRVIGEVRDIIVQPNGGIQFLNVEFNRLQLGTLSLNYRQMGIKPASNGFAMALDDSQVESLYPTLLAEMETAAGEEDLQSVKNMIGAKVKAENGRMIGTVDDVLFNSGATRVEAVYVGLKSGLLRGEHVAIPFGRSMVFKGREGFETIVVNNDVADAALEYAKENR